VQALLDGIEWFLSMQSFTQHFKFEQGDLDYIRVRRADSLCTHQPRVARAR
jgi:hypothetical protein